VEERNGLSEEERSGICYAFAASRRRPPLKEPSESRPS